MVSIITPLYNNEKFIVCAIQSVLNQSFTDLLKNTAIGCSTVMIDRSKVGDLLFFNLYF